MRRLIVSATLFMPALVWPAFAWSAETPLNVPPDSTAKYTILQIGGDWPSRTIVTKRVGPAGTIYAKRLYDCSNNTVKYLGTGDTQEAMTSSKPDANMTAVIPESIADYVGREACKR